MAATKKTPTVTKPAAAKNGKKNANAVATKEMKTKKSSGASKQAPDKQMKKPAEAPAKPVKKAVTTPSKPVKKAVTPAKKIVPAKPAKKTAAPPAKSVKKTATPAKTVKKSVATKPVKKAVAAPAKTAKKAAIPAKATKKTTSPVKETKKAVPAKPKTAQKAAPPAKTAAKVKTEKQTKPVKTAKAEKPAVKDARPAKKEPVKAKPEKAATQPAAKAETKDRKARKAMKQTATPKQAPVKGTVETPVRETPPPLRRTFSGDYSGNQTARYQGKSVAEAKAQAELAARPKVPVAYSKEDLEYFRVIILEKIKDAQEELQSIEERLLDTTSGEANGDDSTYSLHMADQGTDAMEREKAFLFAARERKFISHLSDALQRINSGNYGVCINCSQLIEKGRLEAVPHARMCVNCKTSGKQSE